MGYDARHVLLLECKFWDSPTLIALEAELAKFEKKLDYIQNNLEKFGLNKRLKVIPLFYTPYAPYSGWHSIYILPTAVAFGIKLGAFFQPRKIKLFKSIPELERLLDIVTSPLPFPIDASRIAEELPSNKYNIHDGIVFKYDNNEVTVFYEIPVSLYGILTYLDINEETFCKLRKENVVSGDIIRMLTVNLNDTWTMIQLLDFRRMFEKSQWKSHPEITKPYRRMIELYEYFEKSEMQK
jgi:hypothetical protein